MEDLFKKGIDLTESIVLWPFRTARELAKGNPKLKEAINITEDVVDLPFQMARRLLNKEPSYGEAQGAPSLNNILVNPAVRIVSDKQLEFDQRRAVLEVTGLLCEA